MGFQLQREELLSGEQLQSMLAENPARAAQAILLAAKQGILEGQALLGQILLEGQGIERDEGLAFRWFGIAAQGGHVMARNMLGRCLEHGWGCTADERAAAGIIEWQPKPALIGGCITTPTCWQLGAESRKTSTPPLRCIKKPRIWGMPSP